MNNTSVAVPYRYIAMFAWFLAFGLIGAGAIIGCLYLAAFGLAFSAVAATVTIRCFLMKFANQIRISFELGRDYGQGMRRVQ